MSKQQSSDLADKQPVTSRKGANVKGAHGAALAAVIIADAEAAGKIELKAQQSRKDTLKKLMGFRDNAEHLEFRAALDAKLDTIKKDAEAAKISLNAYSDANPIAASVRATCSLWVKMSTAVERGFTGSNVDLSKPWAEISRAATAHLDKMRESAGSPNGKVTQAGAKQRAGKKPATVVDKARRFVKENLRDEKTNAPLPKENRNLAQVVYAICEDATVEELSEVIAKLVSLRDLKAKLAEEAIAKAKDKGKTVEMPGYVKTSEEVADMQSKTSLGKSKRKDQAAA